MKVGDIVIWLSVEPHKKHLEHIRRFAELVSIEPEYKAVSLRVVQDKAEVIFNRIRLDQIEPMTLSEQSEYDLLRRNDIEARGAVAAVVPKDYTQYKDLSQEVHRVLDIIEASGKRTKRVDLFGEELHIQLEDDSLIKTRVPNPLLNTYALRKWYNIKGQSWGPLGTILQ